MIELKGMNKTTGLTLSKFQRSDIVAWAKWKDEFGVESDTLQVISSWKGNASGMVLGSFILSPDIPRDEPFIFFGTESISPDVGKAEPQRYYIEHRSCVTLSNREQTNIILSHYGEQSWRVIALSFVAFLVVPLVFVVLYFSHKITHNKSNQQGPSAGRRLPP